MQINYYLNNSKNNLIYHFFSRTLYNPAYIYDSFNLYCFLKARNFSNITIPFYDQLNKL